MPKVIQPEEQEYLLEVIGGFGLRPLEFETWKVKSGLDSV